MELAWLPPSTVEEVGPLFVSYQHFIFPTVQFLFISIPLSFLHTASYQYGSYKMTSFRAQYYNPPSGNIQATLPSTTTATVPLNHTLTPGTYPTHIINAPCLANDLKAWAQSYLQSIHHQVPQGLISSADEEFTEFSIANAGDRGTVTQKYSIAVEFRLEKFIAAAGKCYISSIQLVECSQVEGMRGDQKLVRE